MIKQFNREINSDYFDSIYDFKGQWDVPSKCGLKIVKTTDKTIVIATEIYAENPGTSVTGYCAQLAGIICEDHAIPPDKLVFIVHDPDSRSKLSFMNEYFYRVDLSWDGTKFTQPKWNQIDKSIVDNMIKN
jgi:hypothetical protein